MSDPMAAAIARQRRKEEAALVRQMRSGDPVVAAKAPATRSAINELDDMLRRRDVARSILDQCPVINPKSR